jgi:hypothetical protein
MVASNRRDNDMPAADLLLLTGYLLLAMAYTLKLFH